MSNPTTLALKVYAFIHTYQRKTGNCPTYEQIADRFDWSSPNAASGHIKSLRKYGYLAQTTGRSLRISLPEQRKPIISAEIRGKIEDEINERRAALDELTRLWQELGDYE